MLAALLADVEASSLAAALRGSTWAYPLVNAAHIAGIALLFGAIAPLDLRLLGLWRRVPLDLLSQILVPVAATGLGLAATAGIPLFITDARDYAASPFFQAKMAVVAAGAANAALHRALLRRRPASDGSLLPIAGAVSLTAWLGAITLGRLIGYF
jgi:hypothetical protein